MRTKRIKTLAVLAAASMMMIGIASAEEFNIVPSVAKDTVKAPVFSLKYTGTPLAVEPQQVKVATAYSSEMGGEPQARIPGGMGMIGRPRLGGKAFFEANLLVMIGLNAADYFSTRAALKYPGLEETNPLMKPFVKSPAAFAAVKLGSTVLTYLSYKAIFKHNRTAAWVLTTATNALLSYVVVNNVRLVQNARAGR